MTVASTSIEAFLAIRDDGTLTRQQRAILDAVHVGRSYSLQELIPITGFAVNVLSARCHELRALGLLELGPVRPCGVTNRNIHPIRLPAAPSAQGALFPITAQQGSDA